MPTNAPVKFGSPGAVASSERMLASNCCGSHCQSLAFDPVREMQALVVDFDAQSARDGPRESAIGGVNTSDCT